MPQSDMKVEDLKNYGKNIMEMGISSMPAGKKLRVLKATGKFSLKLLWALGTGGTIGLLKTFKGDFHAARELDWSDLLARGISRKDLDNIIKKFVVNKAVAAKIGRDRLQALRFEFGDSASYEIMEEMFASAATFTACGRGDFLPPFKQYYKALMDRMTESGIEAYTIAKDDQDSFQLNVTYCAFYEVAKKLGDPYLCYITSCRGDEVYFGQLCKEAGFEYHREGTLATGKSVCDQCYTRKGRKPEN